jgi:hypothetical protein
MPVLFQVARKLNPVPAVASLAILSIGIAFAPKSSAQEQQAAQIFRQLATVLEHPRCMNCHPRADYPLQGDDRHRHAINVTRGPADRGAPGLHCSACHQSVNQPASGVPGAPDWHLAPPRMAWEGLSIGELCRALLDPARGGMKPNDFIPHFQTGLVRWAWSPGADQHGNPRLAPPIPYEQFLALTREWVAQGTPCPED